MAYLDEWATLETDHVDALSGAVEDLEASTLRLPVTRGAMVCIVVTGQLSFYLITGEAPTLLLCFHFYR